MMNIYLAVGALFVIALAVLLATNAGAGIVKAGGPDAESATHSLGRVIAEARDHPVHIIFVHGMRADGPGASEAFRRGLCRYVKGACPAGAQPVLERSEGFDLGPCPKVEYLERPIWRCEAEWEASRPFVDRYVFRRPDAPPIVVDEVNWWPLLFPLKCRALLEPETNLSGRDRAHLKLCARTDAPFYPWIDEATLKMLLARRPASGGGTWANAALKQQIVNWGVADAVLAVGPMRTYFHRAMDAAFTYAAAFEKRDTDQQEFVVVAESLGGFVVMDAFADLKGESRAVRRVVQSTSDLYFFANQFALLELDRIEGPPPSREFLASSRGAAAGPAAPVARGLLLQWARPSGDRPAVAPPRPRQIIAFSDPSDILTFDVPALLNEDGSKAATVVNFYDRNEFNFFNLFVDPVAAHTGHSRNDAVLKKMFR